MTNATALVAKTTAEAEIKTRPSCPFYGFTGVMGALLDSQGNCCGVAGVHTPCRMEMENLKPNWNNCSAYNKPENQEWLQIVLSHGRIYPDELRPPNVDEWDGVSVRGWFHLILRS